MYSRWLLLAAGLLNACTMDLFRVEAEVDELCVTGIKLEFPGSRDVTLSETHVEDDLQRPAGIDVTLQLLGVQLTAVSGISDFDFLHQLRLTLASGRPESSLPAVELVAFASDGGAQPSPLVIPGAGVVELGPYLDEAALEFGFDLVGSFPPHEWSARVDICFASDARFRPPLP